MRRLVLLSLLFLLLAHGPSPAEAQCTARPTAILRLQYARVPFTTVVLENHTALMVVDTGATGTTISLQAAQLLRLPLDTAPASMSLTVAGPLMRRSVILNHLGIGSLDFGRQSLPIVEAAAPQALAGQIVAGLVGMDHLGQFDIEVNLSANAMALYPIGACAGGEPPWPRGSYEMLAIAPGNREILLPVMLDGRRLTAVLDTGAATELITRSAIERIGMTTEQAEQGGRASRGVAAGNVAFSSRTFNFSTFSVGGEVYRNVNFAITDYTSNADMLLGDDWTRSHRLFISLAAHRMSVQRIDGQPIPALPAAPYQPR
jgi:predicted aspartyl protease